MILKIRMAEYYQRFYHGTFNCKIRKECFSMIERIKIKRFDLLELICDSCHDVLPEVVEFNNLVDILDIAKDNGWYIQYGDGADFCNKCRKMQRNIKIIERL